MLIEGYVHKTGKNCESSVQRNVLSYLGIDLEEEVIFGLDGGFGFMFFQNADDKIDILVGKNDIFPGRALKLLGVQVKEFNSLTGDSGWKAIQKEYLDQNKPIITRVDNGFLPYWKTPKEAFFGGYFVVLCGYENEGEFVYVADNEFEEIQKISGKALAEARASKKSPPINPGNMMYILNNPRITPDVSKVGPVSLRTTVRNFLSASMNNFGYKGLKQFLKCMIAWPEVKKGVTTEIQNDESASTMDTLNFQVQQAGRYIEVYGTGGGCYRNMFSKFLNVLYKETNNSMFNESSGIIQKSAELWQEIGKDFVNLPGSMPRAEVKSIIDDAAAKFEKIINLEKNAFELIRRV